MDNLEKLSEGVKELEERSMKNFSEWRDYLHKYFLIVLTIIGGTRIFSTNIALQNDLITIGIYGALGGVFIGFILINLYFYVERKWMQITANISAVNPERLYNHPDAKGDIKLGIKLNLEEGISDMRRKLGQSKSSLEKKELLSKIAADKKFIRLIKYIGAPFGGFIEKIWFIGVFVSLLLTLGGIILMFMGLS